MVEDAKNKEVNKRKSKNGSIGDVRDKVKSKVANVNKAVMPYVVRKKESEVKKVVPPKKASDNTAVAGAAPVDEAKTAKVTKVTPTAKNVDAPKRDAPPPLPIGTNKKEQADQKDRKDELKEMKKTKGKRKELSSLIKKLNQMYNEDAEFDRLNKQAFTIAEHADKVDRSYKTSYADIKGRTKALMDRLKELEETSIQIKNLKDRIGQQLIEEIKHEKQLEELTKYGNRKGII